MATDILIEKGLRYTVRYRINNEMMDVRLEAFDTLQEAQMRALELEVNGV